MANSNDDTEPSTANVTEERCPGSLRPTTTDSGFEAGGKRFGTCRRCGKVRGVRNGVVVPHTRIRAGELDR